MTFGDSSRVSARTDRAGSRAETFLDRTVGGLSGARGRAAVVTQTVMIVAMVLTLGFSTFYLSYEEVSVDWMHRKNLGAMLGFLVALALVRLGHQLSAAVLGLTVATLSVLGTTVLLGWAVGSHLYLIAIGQLVYLVFTDAQRLWRTTFVAAAGLSFLSAQIWFPPERAVYQLSATTVSVVFTINVIAVALLVYLLAMFTHIRAVAAHTESVANAARVEYLANTDALTGMSNRRPLMDKLESLSQDDAQEYCVGLADLDHFKRLNDEYGHVCGDRVIATIGERLRNQIRASDAVGRWGGEEFLFVLPGATLGDATTMMERVRRIVGEHAVPCAGHSHEVTISIGVACRAPGYLSHRVIKCADDALYRAKQSGRNNVKALKTSEVPESSSASARAINPDGGEGHRDHRRSME